MEIRQATSVKELEGIKRLQQQNLKANLARGEAKTEGFVTAEYSVDFLEKMHTVSPPIVAVDNNDVVGYAIATTKEVGVKHDLLSDLFNTINRLTYRSVRLKQANYIVVGQLCVAKNYRGRGLAKLLYEKFRETYAGAFDFCITDVAEDNPRSLAAHLKSGFEILDTLHYGGISWNIVLWNWKG